VALRCLLVDDNHSFLASASRLLESQGVEVVGRASSGEEAWTLARTLGPDVVLLDVQLGEEDGLDVARQLAADHPVLPVVLISTHGADELAELIARSPAVGFIAKSALSASAIGELLR
jgi:two-component system, NarL family, nitrate/nitrite response regulator NarL